MKKSRKLVSCSCRPGEARTLDPMIKSHVLYQLSYGPYYGITKIVFLALHRYFPLKYYRSGKKTAVFSFNIKPFHRHRKVNVLVFYVMKFVSVIVVTVIFSPLVCIFRHLTDGVNYE